MCGIAGFIGAGTRSDLAAMTRALSHRGPDGEGLYVDGDASLYLGHRRLSIVDLAGGAQPMWNTDETIGVIYNGEIYNHAELRRELEARGYRFRTSHSDTEVLINGYAAWGDGLADRLNGMFAFAIYDQPNRKLFLARDRFGEKPLYYAQKNGFFGFASELSALVRHPALDPTPNPRALQKFFAYGYLPGANALYENCSKLPGGCHLTFDLASGGFAVKRYWNFELQPDDGLREADEDALAEELRALLVEAVRRRLMSDVPLGLFLSGGVDSSAVLACAAQVMPPDQIKTFTIGFDEPSFDESDYALQVAHDFGTTHHTDRLDLGTARDLMAPVLARLDEPLGDPSILPTYLLSRFTREHVTVALSGDGGDELFAGYDPFAALRLAEQYRRFVPRLLHRGIRRLADLLPISDRNIAFDFKVKRALSGLSHGSALWNPVWMAPLEPAMLEDLFQQPLAAEELYAEAIEAWDAHPSLDLTDRTLTFFTQFYLQDDILMKVDRASMMNSLETRAVFLDNDIVEFCQRLPNCWKYRNGQRKYLLKKAMAEWLPPEIVQRPKKGFGIPLAAWLRQMPEPSTALSVQGMRADQVAEMWRAHRHRKADHRLFLWSWLSMQAVLNRGAASSMARAG